MRYHDFHLKGYSVFDFGGRIQLHLVSSLRESTPEESNIEFSNVILYRFIHTMGAIITYIEEETVEEFAHREEQFLISNAHQHGVSLWKDNLEEYILKVSGEGYKVWQIESAIGFEGFVVAKTVSQLGSVQLENSASSSH